jgi:hypothetical protein
MPWRESKKRGAREIIRLNKRDRKALIETGIGDKNVKVIKERRQKIFCSASF